MSASTTSRAVPALLAVIALATTALARPVRAQLTQDAPAPTMWACYVPVTGTVYRVRTEDTRPDCAAKQHVLFGFSVGAKGEPGPQGPQGLQGPPGAQGASGAAAPIAGLEFVQASMPLPPGEVRTHKVACPDGKRVVGGGATVNPITYVIGQGANMVVFKQAPDYSGITTVPNTWQASA